MKRFFPSIFVLLIVLIALQSCSKDDIPIKNYKANEKEYFFQVAKYFSQSNTSKEIRQQIINAVKKEGVEEFTLYHFNENTGEIGTRTGNNQVDLNSIASQSPMITIAYPSLAFHEDEILERHLEAIDYTVLLYDIDPEKVDSLDALTPTGQPVTISSVFDEAKRYCVIKYSEDLIAVNTITNKTYYSDSVPASLSTFIATATIGDFKMYRASDFLNASYASGRILSGLVVGPPVDPPINWPPVPPSSGCDRDVLRKDELHKVKFSSKSCVKNYESGWHLPNIELVATYALPRYNGGSTSVDLVFKDVRIHWKDCTDKFSDPLALDIVTWNRPLYQYGDTWQVLWIERDYWNKVTGEFTLGFNVSFKVNDVTVGVNVAYKVSSQKQDKQLGTSLIEYCDPALNEGSEYKVASCDQTGGFWFKEHIRSF